MASTYYNSFVKKLKEIFMMDHAELDFGIYRIMNQKREDIEQFLDKELLPQVKTILEENNQASAELKAELEKAVQACYAVGINPEESPKVKEIKQKMAASADLSALENEVYSHLTTFFGRYYDEGDFISKRRYKDNTYAIPYNGEEVKLHWANADQYYIKSSEYFRNYTFVCGKDDEKRKVHFVLKDASTEQNNNKAQNNMERRFALYHAEGEATIEVVDNELNIYFTYELMPKATKQQDLCNKAFEELKNLIPAGWAALKEAISSTDTRTLLQKHLTDYTTKNSFDYFIHKDLGGFLRRELDFYIKNEVLHIDDLDAAHINAQLSQVKAIKGVGDKIIRMLAQLENFQKRLWLKKKFVVQSDYCITLDRIPEELYADILANDRQREEWVRLFAIDEIEGDLTTEAYTAPLTEEFLRQNPFLVLDTAFFSPQFKHQLVSYLGDKGVDEQCNGLLINSENFQGSRFLLEKSENQKKCIYLDPPYNTSDVGFLYKNNYRHSSWASMIHDRILNCHKLLASNGVLLLTIDDEELYELKGIIDSVFGKENYIGTVVIEANPRGRGVNSFYATCHEYCLAYAKNPNEVTIVNNELTEEQQKLFSAGEEEDSYRYLPFRRSGGWSTPADRPNSEFPLFFSENGLLFAVGGERITDASKDYVAKNILVWDNVANKMSELEVDEFSKLYPTARMIMPIDTSGLRRVWRWSDREKILQAGAIGDFVLKTDSHGSYVQLKDRIKSGRKPKTVWVDSKFDSSSHGTNLLKKMMGSRNTFGFPKSVYSTEDSLHTIVGGDEAGEVLDLFGGSGTTAHAVMNLNRDGNERKYSLCEMGEYFDKVLRTRVMKVIYSNDWEDGKPVSRQGISQCFKYLRLEQYEDTLNNLELKTPQQAVANFEEGSHFKESYMLGYMLDTETRDSLLNLKMFENPFAMTLKTTKDNELVPTQVDMVETFNYLIGLNVETEDWYRQDNICVVTGRTHRDGLRTLVIWRNCKEISNEELNKFFERMDLHTRDTEYDIIYVNGDNTLPNLRRDEDKWKVVLIEEEFTKRMFEEA